MRRLPAQRRLRRFEALKTSKSVRSPSKRLQNSPHQSPRGILMKVTTFSRAADGSKFKFDSMLIPKKEHRFHVPSHPALHFRIFCPHLPHRISHHPFHAV